MRFGSGGREERRGDLWLGMGRSHRSGGQERIGRRTIEKMLPRFFRAGVVRMLYWCVI